MKKIVAAVIFIIILIIFYAFNPTELKTTTQQAQQGHAESQYNLGVMYKTGKGVKQNSTKAKDWFEKAAQQGHAEAQYSLGAMYITGEAVEKNSIQEPLSK